MPRLGHLPQQSPIRFKAGPQPSLDIAFFQQAFQVIKYQQHPRGAQLLQQQAQAALQALGQQDQRLGREHLQAVLQQGFAGGGITQRAKEHHLKVRRQAVHRAHHQRRFAHASHAQHAHHPAALLEHPVGEGRQFLLASIEAGYVQCLPPIQPWLGGSSALQRLAGPGRGASGPPARGRDASDPAGWRASAHRAAPSGVPLATAPGSPLPPVQKERLAVHCQFNDVFEMLGFGITAAGLPPSHRAPREAQQVGQARLRQPKGGAQREHALAESIVALTIRESLHRTRSLRRGPPGARPCQVMASETPSDDC